MDLMRFLLSLGRDETWLAFYVAKLKLFMHLFIYSNYIYWAFSVPDPELLNQTLGIIKQARYSVHMLSHGIKKTFFSEAFEALADIAHNKMWALQPK